MTLINQAVDRNLSPSGRYAGFISRFLAFTIDSLILVIVDLTTVALVRFTMFTFSPGQRTLQFVDILLIIVLAAFYLLYHVGFLVTTGQTPGKRVMGLMVLKKDGRLLKGFEVLIRLFGYWLFSILFFGYLWVFFDSKRQGWHDKLAGSIVVYTWSESGEA